MAMSAILREKRGVSKVRIMSNLNEKSIVAVMCISSVTSKHLWGSLNYHPTRSITTPI